MDTNGVQMAPFGPKLCQNVAPRLRIIFQTLLGLKNPLRKKKTEHIELKIPIFAVPSQSSKRVLL